MNLSPIAPDPSAQEPSDAGKRIPRRTLAPLLELLVVFGVLGLTGFGGPAAHILRMRELFVEQRRWLDEPRWAFLLGASNLIPGPTSTELALHLGAHRAGLAGMIVAGIAFIAPAAMFCVVLASVSGQWQASPIWSGIVACSTAAVVANLSTGFPRFARPLLSERLDWILAALGVVGTASGIDPFWTLFGSGILTAFWNRPKSAPMLRYRWQIACLLSFMVLLGSAAAGRWHWSTGQTGEPTLWRIFQEFAVLGSSLFGNGNLLLAFAQERLVEQTAWVSRSTLAEAVSVGQATPGPVFSMATFLGYRIAGPSGALVATIGIFLPAFVFVGITHRAMDRLRSSEALQRFLQGLNAASVGTMGWVIVALGIQWADSVVAWIVFFGACALHRWSRWNAVWGILAGAGAGAATGALGMVG